MSKLERVSVALEPETMAALRAAVNDGAFDSVSDAVRDALRSWQNQRRAEEITTLRALVLEGAESGPGLPADQVFARLRSRYGRPAGD